MVDITQPNLVSPLVDMTPELPTLWQGWQEEKTVREEAQLSKLPKELLDILANSAKDLSFSPDETKILYTATASATIPDRLIPPLPSPDSQPEDRQLQPGKLYIYDLKEDRNFFIISESELAKPTPTPTGKNRGIRLRLY